MNQFIDYLITYRTEIVSILVLVITLVVNIFRRKLVWNGVDEIERDILNILPSLILKVEENGNGQRKKEAVLKLIEVYVKKKFGLNLNSSLSSFVDNAIEDILSTPQKKGGRK